MGKLLWWHRVGQKVVCIDDNVDAVIGRPIAEGDTYVIRKAHLSPISGEPGFCLEGIHLGIHPIGFEMGFLAWRFKPIRETSIDCFLSLLTPSPDTVRKLEEVG